MDYKLGLFIDWIEIVSWKFEFFIELFFNLMDVEFKEDFFFVLLVFEDIFSYWESFGNCEV